MEVFLNR